VKNVLQTMRRLSPVVQIGPYLVGKSSPTASLYFENACQNWLAEGRVEKIAPTVFASEYTQLIFRHDAGVPAGFSRPVTAYFMDDYWWPDRNLPWQYQQKSKLLEHRAARYFMPRADWVGVSSNVLQEYSKQEYPDVKAEILNPFWSEPMADLGHFGEQGLEICFLGARSHARDLEMVIPAIRAVLKQEPTARFTLSNTHRLPEDLTGHARVRWLPQMGWQQYRKWIVKQKFHIALYPLQNGPFNAAQSNNKLIEHAVVGATCLCSSHWKNGVGRVIPVSDGPESWAEKLCEVAKNRGLLQRLAKANKAVVLRENQPDLQRQVWEKLLFPK